MFNINVIYGGVRCAVKEAVDSAYTRGFNRGCRAHRSSGFYAHHKGGIVGPYLSRSDRLPLVDLAVRRLIALVCGADNRKLNKLINRDIPKSALVGFRVNQIPVMNSYSDDVYIDTSGFHEEEIVIICPRCEYELFAFDSKDFNQKDYQDMDETNFAELFSKRYDLHCQDGSNNFCHRCGQRLLLPNDKNYVCRIDEDW